MKTVPVQDAVGKMLCHDITQIVPGFFKGRAFKKGRIIKQADVDKLLDMGKANIYVQDMKPGMLHEDEAARRIAEAAAGGGLRLSEPAEGKVNLISTEKGLLSVNTDALSRINEVEDIMFASRHTHFPVQPDMPVAGTRIIPLYTDEERIQTVEAICRHFYPLVEVKPFTPVKVGVVTTGSEIYHGRIEDKFGPVLRKKFEELGSEVIEQRFVSDDIQMTVDAIHELIARGAEFIALTGGMSVDPDDQTPTSIRVSGARVVTYGAPVLPGAMFMLAYMGTIPVVGLPGCVMYYHASIFDLVIPRLLTGETLTKKDIAAMGHGAFCANCPDCRYPDCPFGKMG
ncbi:molybdopterin binding domain protein [Desulfosarcina variabilis str. Montpellier]|uniref:molybdopterin-binding protein n=1 Tax=Desulfosarcina variabilis TaxID=2300 RepID=UPI003AFAD87E